MEVRELRRWARRWDPDTRHAALAWLAANRKSDIFSSVPVTTTAAGHWPENTSAHWLDGVAVSSGSGTVREWEEKAFADEAGGSLWPLLAWGYADRPALGKILATTAMLSRSFPGHGPLHPLVLVAEREAAPNTAPAYFARGIELIVVPDRVLP